MTDVYEVEGVIVDAETGEIIESKVGDPTETIIRAGLEAGQQTKFWERYQSAMKFAAGSLLTPEHPKAETPAGVAKRITQNRRRATPEMLPVLARDFELTNEQITRI